MRIVVTGIQGQVGFELHRTCQPIGEVIGLDRQALDLADPQAIRRVLREAAPQVILNPAAYTAVDQAEQDERTATAVNGAAVAVMAEEATRLNALLVQYSTDYVFDGTKEDAYIETDTPNPQCAYGRSKLMGEQALRESKADWLCLRTSWVYASRGRNFLRTILRLAAEREDLRVVADQIGAPTPARLIADATAQILTKVRLEREEKAFSSGIYHLCAAGSTSWHGFASEIIDQVRRADVGASLKVKRLAAIETKDYPTPAKRPRNSRLSCTALETRFDLKMPNWQTGVALCVSELG